MTNSKLKNNVTPIAMFIVATIASFLVLMLIPRSVDAATIEVEGACSLDDAIQSVSSGSDQSGCTATGDAYGTNDTINLPSGVHTYTASQTIDDVAVSIVGAGMGITVIDSGDSAPGLRFNNTTGSVVESSISDLSIRGVDTTVGTAAIQSFQTSLTVERVEIYSATASDARAGISLNHNFAGITSVVRDVYIHDIDFIGQSALEINATDGISSSNNLIENITIENVSVPSNYFAIGLSGTGGGTLEGTVQNSTINNVDLADNSTYIAAFSSLASGSGTRTTNLLAQNNTLVAGRNITTANGLLMSPIVVAAGQTANATVTAQNNIIVTRYNDTAEALGCAETIVPSGGTPTATFTSTGGNLTDDASNCDSFFVQTNDQTAITNLGSTIGALADNGGNVMTMALLEGSPAIDNGITNAVTTDQRGTSRPQGSAFDTGAFEFVASTPSPGDDGDGSSGSSSLADTGTNATLILIVSITLIGIGGYAVRRVNT